MTQPIHVDTEAHLLGMDLRPGQVVESLTLEAIANDIAFGLMGISNMR